MSNWWPYVRLIGAALIFAAIAAQLWLTVSIALESTTPWGSHLLTVVANFLSFFTILSNILAMVALAIAAALTLRPGRRDAPAPAWLATLLLCATTYMLVTGIVYNTLLRGIELPQGSTVGWSNEMLHVIAPLIMLADLLFAPRPRRLPWGSLLLVAAFPIAWAVYTLVRANLVIAPATGNAWWYPYPFLDPHQSGGYLAVTGYIIGIAAVIVCVGALSVWVGRRRA